jgi:hypothetical protein
MAAAPTVSGDHGFPLGGLCGWVDYEGGFVFGDYPEMLVFDHADHSWWETGSLSGQLAPSDGSHADIGPFEAVAGRRDFVRGVERIKDWIAGGDIYQVNLSQAFTADQVEPATKKAIIQRMINNLIGLAQGESMMPPPAAVPYFSLLIALDPEDTSSRFQRAAARATDGDSAGAREDFKAILDNPPSSMREDQLRQLHEWYDRLGRQ